MEDTLRDRVGEKKIHESVSLNPYYNGRYSTRQMQNVESCMVRRLNPYYNGRYSTSTRSKRFKQDFWRVLILIIMEDTLRVIKKAK